MGRIADICRSQNLAVDTKALEPTTWGQWGRAWVSNQPADDFIKAANKFVQEYRKKVDPMDRTMTFEDLDEVYEELCKKAKQVGVKQSDPRMKEVFEYVHPTEEQQIRARVEELHHQRGEAVSVKRERKGNLRKIAHQAEHMLLYSRDQTGEEAYQDSVGKSMYAVAVPPTSPEAKDGYDATVVFVSEDIDGEQHYQLYRHNREGDPVAMMIPINERGEIILPDGSATTEIWEALKPLIDHFAGTYLRGG